jgi:HK97 family phage major capsid protein
MTPEELKEFSEKFGKQAAEEMKQLAKGIEENLSSKFNDVSKGLMRQEDFENFKKEELEKINTHLKKLDDASREQGIKMGELLEKAPVGSKSFEQFITELSPKIRETREAGKYMEFTGAQLKAAGITSIANSIQAMTSPPGSPYAPGIGGADLDLFEIMRNPNFIINRVDVGRTSQSRLAWANETVYEPGPAVVAEGGSKPLTQHKFQVEMSQAKKIAGYVTITDEFESDLPGFATTVRRMLQDDVIRVFDDTVQTDVRTVSRPFEITNFNGQVTDANMYDGLGALLAQITANNFTSNTIALNPITMWKMFMSKSSYGEYLTPPFLDMIRPMIVQANKVAPGFAMVGDFNQYKVDIYKDFVLKIGWVNDDFIKNQFAIVGEIRFHSYISDARKKALAYHNVQYVANAIDGTPRS